MRSLVLVTLSVLLLANAPAASALPTPGIFCDASDLTLGRLFPEAEHANDYVSYEEALCGLDVLLDAHPEWIKKDVVTQSVGWGNVAGGHDTFEVFVIRVSNYESALPTEDKLRIVFQLSIHGNEKGGREGGLRVIEDFARDMGFAKEHPELRAYLDYMELLFVFPNPDGWTHEEVHYRANNACYFDVTPPGEECEAGEPGAETQNFVRVNGHGVDVNREWPTVGWTRERYTPMSEPEAVGLVAYLKNETNLAYASDIHGMLNPADNSLVSHPCTPSTTPDEVGGFDAVCFGEAVTGAKGHFVLTMLPAGRQSPEEMAMSTSLAELVKERLNNDPDLAGWSALPGTAGAWGGEYNDWGTVWDTIGYTDSGFTSDFYAQDTGLDTPGVDFELAYNHITVDNYYTGAGQLFNILHVETVREIVRAFMDQAALDLDLRVDAKGARTAFLENPTIVTNAGNLGVTGWALENDADDAFDTAHVVYEAAPGDYFEDLRPVLADGSLDMLTAGELASRLADYDNLVVAGSAYRTLAQDPAALDAVRAWVEAGGNLVLTDEALQMLEPLGVVAEGAVAQDLAYAGHTNFVDRDHALAQGIRGLARETYEPVPLGFAIDDFSAPVWFVPADAFEGEVVGVAGSGQGAEPDATKVNFGQASLGAGTVRFLGALLPDPSVASYAPYGLDSYATTYTGNQLLRNMLGWELSYEQPPKALDQLGSGAGEGLAPAAAAEVGVPSVGLVGVLALLGALALARRRA